MPRNSADSPQVGAEHSHQTKLALSALGTVLDSLDIKNDQYCLAGRFAKATSQKGPNDQITITSLKLGLPAVPKRSGAAKDTSDI